MFSFRRHLSPTPGPTIFLILERTRGDITRGDVSTKIDPALIQKSNETRAGLCGSLSLCEKSASSRVLFLSFFKSSSLSEFLKIEKKSHYRDELF